MNRVMCGRGAIGALALGVCAAAATGQVQTNPTLLVLTGTLEVSGTCVALRVDGGGGVVEVGAAAGFQSGDRVRATGRFVESCLGECDPAGVSGCLLEATLEPAPTPIDVCGQVLITGPGPEGTSAAGAPCTLLDVDGVTVYWVPFGEGVQNGDFLRVQGELNACQIPCFQSGCIQPSAITMCGGGGHPGGAFCGPDFNRSGALNVQDIYDFLTAWMGRDGRADYDVSGAVTVQDVYQFLDAWTGGC